MADNVHKALDIAGFIPGIGSFSEGANSLLYAFQGEKGEAALAALSAIPGIKAVKVLKDGIQYLKIIPESGEASKALKELYDAEKTAGNTGHVIDVTAESSKVTLNYITTSGIKLEATPGKTTTVLGTYKADTKKILNELGNVKSRDCQVKCVNDFKLKPDIFVPWCRSVRQ